MRSRSRAADREGDAALTTRAASRDRAALETLLERHVDNIHAVCRRVRTDREDASDATQEAMITVARGIGRYDGEAAFKICLYRVATNTALDEGRRKARRPRSVEAPPDTLRVASPEEAVGARVGVDAALRDVPEARACPTRETKPTGS